MAIIKCPNCGKNVSDNDSACAYCRSPLNSRLICPRCKSKNTDVYIKTTSDVKSSCLSTIIWAAFGLIGTLIANMFTKEYTVKYICKDCGKKFKSR